MSKLKLNESINKVTGKTKGLTFFSQRKSSYVKKSIKNRVKTSYKQNNINKAFQILVHKYKLLQLNYDATMSWIIEANIRTQQQGQIVTCYSLFTSIFMKRYIKELGSSVIPIDLLDGISLYFIDNGSRHWIIRGWNIGGWNTGYYGR